MVMKAFEMVGCMGNKQAVFACNKHSQQARNYSGALIVGYLTNYRGKQKHGQEKVHAYLRVQSTYWE